jgi:hypothetical protein
MILVNVPIIPTAPTLIFSLLRFLHIYREKEEAINARKVSFHEKNYKTLARYRRAEIFRASPIHHDWFTDESNSEGK